MEAAIQRNYEMVSEIPHIFFSWISGRSLEPASNENQANDAKKMPAWDREEVVLLVSEYFRTCNMPRSDIDNSIEFISKTLRRRAKRNGMTIGPRYRNINGIQMKFGNIQSLDRDRQKEGYSGLKNVSILEKAVVEEYYTSPEKINQEAYFVIMKYARL